MVQPGLLTLTEPQLLALSEEELLSMEEYAVAAILAESAGGVWVPGDDGEVVPRRRKCGRGGLWRLKNLCVRCGEVIGHGE